MAVGKILSLEDLARRLEFLRRDDRKIVHCHGCFDLLHIGHIRHLQAARTMGDVLVVTITADEYVDKGEGRPAFAERLRAEALAALECVDFVSIAVSPTAVEAIRLLRPHYYVKGHAAAERWSVKLRQEMEMVRAVGGEARFTAEVLFSSTELLNAHFRVPQEPSST